MQSFLILSLSAVTLSVLLVEMGHMHQLNCKPPNQGGSCLLPQTCNCSMPPEHPNGSDHFTYNVRTNSCIPIKTMETRNTSCNVFDNRTQCEYFCADGEEYYNYESSEEDYE
nr:uncharacterized protein LOC129380262 [Dermacentor andersoni]